MQILIVTRNVLNEQKIQEQLQRLNHEVFVSSSILNLTHHQFVTRLLDYFNAIIFSESVTDKEVLELLPAVNKEKHVAYRKIEKRLDRVDQEYWSDKGIDGWMMDQFSLEKIRELFSNEPTQQSGTELACPTGLGTLGSLISLREAEPKPSFKLTEIHFKGKEKCLLDALAKKSGEVYSREELCRVLWNQEPDRSKMAQLSYIIKRIKQRFKDHGINEELLVTMWGKGYQLTDSFYDYFPIEERKKIFQ
ncbi:transcriptional regulator [Enterococcus florum]|uniref:Transcriptional regulator n=1 Tax=Enterococcus florum TaxID=2480627 RepID=A0A4P5PCI2_9ENTE|nr:helix-turn-helix domain-containing protein [Enterococcus florum]GCF95830.1 transcriptional regulator [Enterococcus florum]